MPRAFSDISQQRKSAEARAGREGGRHWRAGESTRDPFKLMRFARCAPKIRVWAPWTRMHCASSPRRRAKILVKMNGALRERLLSGARRPRGPLTSSQGSGFSAIATRI